MSERSQTQKAVYCMIPFLLEKAKPQGQRTNQLVVSRKGAGEEIKGKEAQETWG